MRPDFVVCDEPVTALDVSVRAQIVNLLLDLQHRYSMAYLFIAHDLALVSHLCDRVAVMYLGRVVEQAPTGALLSRPRHPYTAALFAASLPPRPEQARGIRARLSGEIPSPAQVPAGCRFHTRCPFAVERCRADDPAMREFGPGHTVACHRAEEIEDEVAAEAAEGRSRGGGAQPPHRSKG